ncbi:MAG: hypothetical protein AMXMBFR78_03830 [Rubrivivax sp.]
MGGLCPLCVQRGDDARIHGSIIDSLYATMIDMETVTLSSKYQIVIPRAVRERLQLKAGSRLSVVDFAGSLRLIPVQPPSALRGIARGIDPQLVRDDDRPL